MTRLVPIFVLALAVVCVIVACGEQGYSRTHSYSARVGPDGSAADAAEGGPMEFGMFHEFQRLPGVSEAEAFAQSFAQVDAAERLGLDAMWLAELHFAPERSVLASPLILASAIAARTKTMKIGTA